jgi:hypothetical protein
MRELAMSRMRRSSQLATSRGRSSEPRASQVRFSHQLLYSHARGAWGAGAAPAAAAALNARLARWVFAIPPDRAKLLRTKPADLVEPTKG